MKRAYALIMLLAVVAGVTITGCNKDDNGGIVFSSLTDSTGTNLLQLTYDNNKRLVKIVADQTSYDLFYNGDRLTARTLTRNGSLANVDSIFYDGNGRMVRFDTYNDNNVKQKSTVFTFNADNTVNSATINNNSFLIADQMFEFIYSGSNYSEIKEYEKVVGSFNIRRKFEFLAYDNKSNPIQKVIKSYFPDQFNLLIFMWGSHNNFTSAKQTDYNLGDGGVTGSFPATAAYTYNGDNLPEETIVTINGNTNKVTFHYTAL